MHCTQSNYGFGNFSTKPGRIQMLMLQRSVLAISVYQVKGQQSDSHNEEDALVI
jgi:hypothetical protein